MEVADEEETVVATYAYDALTRRIVRAVGAEDPVHTYWSNQWKPLEERVGADTDPERQYVWGARPGHRDELILRDRDSTGDGTLDERLYATMDYFNATGALDADGDVVERYAYSAFGVRRVMAPDFTPRAASTVDWAFAFQGQFLDPETGYYDYGYRYYSSRLGRWLGKDPLQVQYDINRYQAFSNNGVNSIDLFGLKTYSPDETFDSVDEGQNTGVAGHARVTRWRATVDCSYHDDYYWQLDFSNVQATVAVHAGTASAHEQVHLEIFRANWAIFLGYINEREGMTLCTREACECWSRWMDLIRTWALLRANYFNSLFHITGGWTASGIWVGPESNNPGSPFYVLLESAAKSDHEDMNEALEKANVAYLQCSIMP